MGLSTAPAGRSGTAAELLALLTAHCVRPAGGKSANPTYQGSVHGLYRPCGGDPGSPMTLTRWAKQLGRPCPALGLSLDAQQQYQPQ